MTDTGQVTAADAINAAADVIDGITSGSLRPADVQRRAVDAMRETFGIMSSGPDCPLHDLHLDVCRQALAAGYLTSQELREWLAVQERREADVDLGPQ